MIINPEKYRGSDTEDIVDEFVEFVTKTDEEVAKEGQTKKKQSTELKIYLADNLGLSPENLVERILELVESGDLNENPREFFEEHNFNITQLNSEAFQLIISTPQYNRDDEFILIDSDGYLKALTVIRRSWAKDTIEKLINYIPEYERLFLSSENLKSIVQADAKRDLTGFTAKYEPFFKEEYVSVQVHGGSDDHLTEVEDTFSARPKRVVFSQRNSPAEAVKTAVSQDGYASVPRVREGSQDVGYETIENVVEKYQEKDKENFEVEYRPERLTPGPRYFLTQLTLEESSGDTKSDGGIPDELKDIDQGSVLEGLTICVFEEDVEVSDYPDDDAVAAQLEQDILDHKRRYRFSEIDDNNYLVYDGDRGQSFEVVVSDKNLRVYSRSNTTAAGLRDFYEILDTEFNASYRINRTSKKVKA